MKRKIYVVIVAILCICCVISLINLGSGDGFKKISSVRFKTNGEWLTWSSYFGYSTTGVRYDSSQTEYNSVSSHYKISSTSSLTYNIKSDDTYYNPGYKEGDYLYYTLSYLSPYYFKIKVTGKYLSYVYIKEVSSDTIIVRRGEKGKETTYTVSAYTITHFD